MTAKKRKPRTHAKRRWSQRVTRESHALDLEPAVFSGRDPKRIARSLKHSAERSRRRKTSAYRSAMSMITFYPNRAAKKLPAAQRRTIEKPRTSCARFTSESPRGTGCAPPHAAADRGRWSAVNT
jgi:hypothetical protein